MEKAILKTLIYADLFDYPLKGYEIHKWLIGKTATFRQVEKALEKLLKKGNIKNKSGYYFLSGRNRIVVKRQDREKQSRKFFLRAKFLSWFLKFIPSVKLVGISGGVAVNNASKGDDIDLFLITQKGKLWLTRLLVLSFFDFMGVRRKVGMNQKQSAGRVCLNIFLDENFLKQQNQDLYIAHEVLQMKLLWDKDNTYQKYLAENDWAFNFLPNWIGEQTKKEKLKRKKGKNKMEKDNKLENWAKWFQLKIMQKPQGLERISEQGLYFHPNDVRGKILTEYKLRIKKL